MARDEFLCGYVTACSAALTNYVEADVVAEMLGAAGIHTMRDLRRTGCDSFDVKKLRPALAEAAKRRRHRRELEVRRARASG
jgi:hypothetical protein